MRARAKALAPTAALACLVAFLFLSLHGAAHAQPAPTVSKVEERKTPGAAGPQEPKSSVWGRAISEETGRPLRHVRVVLLSLTARATERSTLTNARGEFRLSRMPEGIYLATVDVAGMLAPASFIEVQQFQSRRFDIAEIQNQFEIVQVDGTSDREIVVRARRGGSISGRVVYEDGDPAVNVQVKILRQRNGRVGEMISSRNPLTYYGLRTDDRGVFRAAGLAPGEYLVGVSENLAHNPEQENIPPMLIGGTHLLTIYHPSTTDIKKATAVSIEAGAELSDVNITIPDIPTRTLKGIVRGRIDRRPLAKAKILLEPLPDAGNSVENVRNEAVALTQVVETDEQGRWQLNEVPDGVYKLHVSPNTEYEAVSASGKVSTEDDEEKTDEEDEPYSVVAKKGYAPHKQEIKVDGEDLNIVSEMNTGGRIKGVIVVEGLKKSDETELHAAITLVSLGDGNDVVYKDYTSAVGGAFSVDGIPSGKLILSAQLFGSDDAVPYLKSITWKGKDLMREPLVIEDGKEINDIRFVFAGNSPTVQVRVLWAKEKIAAHGARVFMVPASGPVWQKLDAQISCDVATDGTCNLTSAPGEYMVVALPYNNLTFRLDEAQLEEVAAEAQRITLRAGDRKSLELKLPTKDQ